MLPDHLPGQHADGGGGDVLRLQLPVYLSPQNMADAKAQNIPVLSYLANHFASMSGTKSTFATLLEYGASIIARGHLQIVFGHYLGTLEG